MCRLQQFTFATLMAAVLLINYSEATHQKRICYVCEGINCQRTSLMEQKPCETSLDYCVTIFDKARVVQKGCSLEVPMELRRRCDANSAECDKCNTDRCNILGQRNYLCLQCDSRTDLNCAENPSAVMPQRCASPKAPNSYCFVKYVDGSAIRGCATNVADQMACQAAENCMLCLSSDLKSCNHVDFAPASPA